MLMLIVILLAASVLRNNVQYVSAVFRVGAGITDITGPPNDIVFMGYANEKQVGSGIHLPLKSRSFIIESGDSSYKSVGRKQIPLSTKLIGFVSVDGGMASDIVKTKVIAKVNKVLGMELFNVVS